MKYNETLKTSLIKGEVFIFFSDPDTGKVIDKKHLTNIVTLDASILIARLFANNLEPRNGMKYLAFGTGINGGDLMNPSPATSNQRSLVSEIARKPFHKVSFVDDQGNETLIPTHVVDFTATFSASEAVGPLVELGIIGGDSVPTPNPVANGPYDPTIDLTGVDTLCTYLTFPVINKPNSLVMTVTYRMTF